MRRTLPLVIALLLTSSGTLFAQATRTWVSGVGDDVNPCSRTAPCKTFAGAISKTAADGEIDTLDPGGFGGVTITKSITIDGGPTAGGVLVGGSNGIVINSPTAKVVLRNLSILGVSNSIDGIRIVDAASVLIENVRISGFTGKAINVIPATAQTAVSIIDTTITHNNGQGIQFLSSPNAQGMTAFIRNVQIHSNGGTGIFLGNGTQGYILDSNVAKNARGVMIEEIAGNTDVEIIDTVISGNTGVGLESGTGTPQTRLSNVTITNNGTGVLIGGAGAVRSYGNNHITSNTAGNGPLSGSVVGNPQ
jgi:hypothetical protein